MKRRPKTLYCYKENDIQKWIMSDRDNDKEVLLNILMNKNVDKASIFAIPAEGLMFGVIWIWQEAHNDASQSIWEFFEEYNRPQTELPKHEEATELAHKIEKEEDFKHNSLFGFISPDGRYFHCDYQGHHSLAYDICFGQFETNNPEKYLEEHGWCKIYSPYNKDNKYAVYVGGNYVLTKEQMNKLSELGLENAKNISDMLVK
jgi:hypothetical protein